MMTTTTADKPTPSEVEAQVQELLKRPYLMTVRGDPEDGYLAEATDLPGCISAGATPVEAMTMLQDAMAGWFEARLMQGLPIPDPQPQFPPVEHFSGKILLRTSPYFHRALVERARNEGVSLNQWILMLLAQSAPQPRP